MNQLRILVVLFVIVLGCEQQPKKEQALARVGDAVLTMEQARSAIDTSVIPFDHQLRNFVSSWITTELLYQEAARKGIEQRSEFQRELLDIRKQLAIQQLLNLSIYGDSAEIPEEEALHYFERHRSEFILKEEMRKMNLIGFTARERANVFAARIIRGLSWDDAYRQLLQDSTVENEIVFAVGGKHYSQQTCVFPELWKVAQTLGENDVSFPVRTATGYFIIQLLATLRNGTDPPFEVVREEARIRWLRNRQQQGYDSLIGTLRRQYSVEILLPDVHQNDTNQYRIHD